MSTLLACWRMAECIVICNSEAGFLDTFFLLCPIDLKSKFLKPS
jgi:hypothetical protein